MMTYDNATMSNFTGKCRYLLTKPQECKATPSYHPWIIEAQNKRITSEVTNNTIVASELHIIVDDVPIGVGKLNVVEVSIYIREKILQV